MKKLLLRRIKLFALLLFAIVFLCPSCKKDELTAQKLPKPEHVVQKINFDKFRSQVNFNSLGFLKPNFVNFDRTEKLMSIGEVSLSTKLEVYTDTIDKITSATGTSYIFRMPLSSPHARSFRNFTIDVQGGKTKAFIATYFPTEEWISAYKARKSIPFDGTISFAPVNLEELNIIESLGTIKGNPHEKLMGIGGKTMDYSMCTDYTIYMYTPYGCSQGGHMPWDPDCPWNGGTTPSGEYPGGYSFSSTTYTTCETITTGGGAGGSGSGGGTGGGTTPSPPPGYNPCPQIPDPNILVSYERGTRLMSAPSVPCDPLPPVTPPSQPTLNAAQSTLLSNSLINQDNSIKDFITNNTVLSIELDALLKEEDYSYESQIAAAMMIKGTIANQVNWPNSQTLYANVSSVMPGVYPDFGLYFSTYFSTECAIIKYQHPDWPRWKVFWHASKEMIHLTLDGAGLIPVYGEVADVANGVMYLVEGDGTNATLSFVAVIPIAGWWATGAKYAKKTLNLANGSKTTLKWVVVAGETIHFGNRSQLRKVLQLAKGDARQAHHIIPWAKSTNWAIQKAAKSKHFFHMNDILNGIPLNNLAHSGSHNLYDNRVVELLEDIPKNLTPEQTYDEVLAIISHIRNAINNYPNVPLNQLIL